MTFRARIAATAAFVFATAFAAGAAAQEGADAAERLFRVGRDALQQGRISDACAALQKSYEIDPKLGTLVHLGYCHALQGRTATALVELQRAEKTPQVDRDRASFIQKQLGEVRVRLSRVRLTVRAPWTISSVKVDGAATELDESGAFAADPGAHTITASLSGNVAWQDTVNVSTDPGVQTIAVVPVTAPHADVLPPAPDQAPAEDESPRSRHPLRAAGLVIGGVGIVGLGLGTYFGIHTFDLKNSAQQLCGPAPPTCTTDKWQTAESHVNDARTAATISTVAFAAGGVATVAGVFLFFSSRSDGQAEGRGTSAQVSPLVLRQGGGLAFDMRW